MRLVDETGKQIGIVSLTEALRISRERNLDLIQVTEKLEIPVCKLGDYGKYLYQLQKKERKEFKKMGELKTVRLSFNISLHDMETKANQTKKFLEKGNKVKAQLFFKGREITHKEVGMSILNEFKANLGENAKVEQEAKFVGREVSMIFSPVKKA